MGFSYGGGCGGRHQTLVREFAQEGSEEFHSRAWPKLDEVYLETILWSERTSGIDCEKVYKDMLDSELKGGPYETEIDLRPEYKVFGNG
jgi:hypothetical protein